MKVKLQRAWKSQRQRGNGVPTGMWPGVQGCSKVGGEHQFAATISVAALWRVPFLIGFRASLPGIAGLIFLLALLGGMAQADELTTSTPSMIKAGFLRNFAHYVTWPTNSFAGETAPWHIGILGDDPFGDVLEKTFKGRTEQGRSFETSRAMTLDQLPPCQIVFIAYKDAAKRRAALAAFKNQPVLTVGDSPDFLQEGGIIRFQVKDRVKMSVNLDQARAVSLNIQTKILEVSNQVLENGTLRTLR